MTRWRDIAWWDDYAVSDRGEVVRKKDGVIMKQYVQKSGYAAVYLRKNGWVSAVMVHRIVAEAFLPRIEGKDMVDHINTIRHANFDIWMPYSESEYNTMLSTMKSNGILSRKTAAEQNTISRPDEVERIKQEEQETLERELEKTRRTKELEQEFSKQTANEEGNQQ